MGLVDRNSSAERHSAATAARTVVRKWFTEAAAKTVERVPNEQIPDYVPSAPNRRRSNPVTVWIFNPQAR